MSFRVGVGFFAFLLFASGTSSASPEGVVPLLGCGAALSQSRAPGSPQDYFGRPSPDGSPRYVMLIGTPGSGKSTWASAAPVETWERVTPDEIRVNRLKEMQALGVLLTLDDGLTRTPADPENSSHIFSGQMLAYGFSVARERISAALQSRRNIVDDKINATPGRALDIWKARNAGYWVEALVFITSSVDVNIANVQRRAAQGGIFLNPALMQKLHDRFWFYNQTITVDPSRRAVRYRAFDQMLTLHWNDYAETFPNLGNLRAALHGLDPFEAAMAENVFNEVRVVHQSAPFPEIPR